MSLMEVAEPKIWRDLVVEVRAAIRDELKGVVADLTEYKASLQPESFDREKSLESQHCRPDLSQNYSQRQANSTLHDLAIDARKHAKSVADMSNVGQEKLKKNGKISIRSEVRMPLSLRQSSNDGYQLVSVTEEDCDAMLGRLLQVEEEADEEAEALRNDIAEYEARGIEIVEQMAKLQEFCTKRRQPLQDELKIIQQQEKELRQKLEIVMMPFRDAKALGPALLAWTDGDAFTFVCGIIVAANLVCMVLESNFNHIAVNFWLLNQFFLIWYIFELSVKALYFQRRFLCGELSLIWWNWMDLGIVLSGMIEQWLVPLTKSLNADGTKSHASGLRALRFLRLFRITRALKIVKAFLQSDLSWTEGDLFESFMSGIIAVNSICMSLELDYPWNGWSWVENGFLLVYFFELCLRLKRQGCTFFCDLDDWLWNYLDFLIVTGGALDMWLLPLLYLLRGLLLGKKENTSYSGVGFGGLLKVLRLLRILRVLRLVKLLKMVRPLYKLLNGVVESLRAMQWVVVLTVLTLYAFAIVFTSLVGKGYINNGKVNEAASQYFGTVSKSLFSLFKLMNGDMSVVIPITTCVQGQLLFAGFMVISNWAILAILTSVVSDNMITASRRDEDKDDGKLREEQHAERVSRLKMLFNEIDTDSNGYITLREWVTMMNDSFLKAELIDATGLTEEDLDEYFRILSNSPEQYRREKYLQRTSQSIDRKLDYNSFIGHLKDEGTTADKRSILSLVARLKDLETLVAARDASRKSAGLYT